jgi:hypothetical protein
MDKFILAALLKIWLEDLTTAIDGLEAFPPLKDGRKVIRLEDESELAKLWDVRSSISELIEALEK